MDPVRKAQGHLFERGRDRVAKSGMPRFCGSIWFESMIEPWFAESEFVVVVKLSSLWAGIHLNWQL